MKAHTEYLSAVEAARRLTCSPWTVRGWIKRGRLKAFKVGTRLVRIPETEIERLLSPHTPEEDE